VGLTLGGSLVWAVGLALSFAWPGLIAIAYAWFRAPRIHDSSRYLGLGIPLSYAVIFVAHAWLADIVIVGAQRAAETGSVWLVWWRLGFVLGLETAIAALALYVLEQRLRARAST
jgi:hypothetical protein